MKKIKKYIKEGLGDNISLNGLSSSNEIKDIIFTDNILPKIKRDIKKGKRIFRIKKYKNIFSYNIDETVYSPQLKENFIIFSVTEHDTSEKGILRMGNKKGIFIKNRKFQKLVLKLLRF